MTSKNLKLTGLFLILGGMTGLAITVAGISKAYKVAETNASASDLAGNVSSTLLPASIGAPVALIGLILLLLGWRRSRKAIS